MEKENNKQNISISKANVSEIATIQSIVRQTWPDTYSEIITGEQIEYMLDRFYDAALLENDIKNENQLFFMAKEGEDYLGFAAITPHFMDQKVTRLHKLYLLPSAQGKGVGRMLLDFIESFSLEAGDNKISLNVNKYNKAVFFYEKMGFLKVDEEILDLGHNGYVMDDFKMEKTL